MRKPKLRFCLRTTLAVALGLFCAGASSIASGSETGSSIGCRAKLSPDTLTSGSSDRLHISLSEWLGAITAVSADADSGLEIQQIEPGAESSSVSSWRVEIDASNATAGSWTVTLEGESGTCVGTLHVVDP